MLDDDDDDDDDDDVGRHDCMLQLINQLVPVYRIVKHLYCK